MLYIVSFVISLTPDHNNIYITDLHISLLQLILRDKAPRYNNSVSCKTQQPYVFSNRSWW